MFVLPVPAGHTLGAAGFLFRIDDLQNNETVTVLTTGDFTTRPVGGYPSLTIPESIDIDIMIANAATSPHFEDKLNDALEVLLERGLSGATTLVAASALTGVHMHTSLDMSSTRLTVNFRSTSLAKQRSSTLRSITMSPSSLFILSSNTPTRYLPPVRSLSPGPRLRHKEASPVFTG